jgi:sulfate adenylyltransferase subunit 1 (EFTu-like GTPase family)
VIRTHLDFRGYAGRIDSGRIRPGDPVRVLPSGKRSRVQRIVTFDGDLEEASAPMAVTLVLEDELDISRGDWICAEPEPPRVASRFEASVVWMHEKPLQPGAEVLLQQGTTRVPALVREIVHRVDPETVVARPAADLSLNEIGRVRIESLCPLVFDRYRDNRQTGAFVLIDRIGNSTLAAGMIEGTDVAVTQPDDDSGLIEVLETQRLREFLEAAFRELTRRGAVVNPHREVK